MHVSSILREKGTAVHTIEPGITVAQAIKLLHEKEVGALVVTEEGASRPAGIISERDIVQGLAVHGEAFLHSAVSDCMASPVTTCSPNDTEQEILALMTDRRFRHLPVTENGVLCGIVSIGDVVKARIDDVMAEADALKAYIANG